MTEYVVSWHLRGTTIVEAESEAAAKEKIYRTKIAEICPDGDSFRVSDVNEIYEIEDDGGSDAE